MLLGPNRTTSPSSSCNRICSTSGRRLYTIQNLHQSVREAMNGPGYLFNPRLNRLLAKYATNATPRTAGQLCRSTAIIDSTAMTDNFRRIFRLGDRRIFTTYRVSSVKLEPQPRKAYAQTNVVNLTMREYAHIRKERAKYNQRIIRKTALISHHTTTRGKQNILMKARRRHSPAEISRSTAAAPTHPIHSTVL